MNSKLISLFCFVFATIGGGLLIGERLLNEDNTGPKDALLQSLNMLVVTEGKERTVMEYRQILEKHGFVDFEAKQIESTLGVDAILCRKV